MSAAIMISLSTYLFIANAINTIRTLYTVIIFVWALFSWFNHSRGILKDIYSALDKLAGPFVGLFRKVLPTAGGIDFSPLVAIIVVQLIGQALIWVLGSFFMPF